LVRSIAQGYNQGTKSDTVITQQTDLQAVLVGVFPGSMKHFGGHSPAAQERPGVQSVSQTGHPGVRGRCVRAKLVPGEVLFVLPNRQVFSSETAKGNAGGPPFVNEDESLVAMTCHPATQTGDLHIYIKEQNGKYRELPNEENGAVNDLLREAYDNFAGWTLEVRGITGRTLTVWAIVKGQWIEKGGDIYWFEFKLHVTPDGKIALTKVARSA
jgi:hypothetical protein